MDEGESSSQCIVCKSDILPGAKKCLKCSSRQDWLRFLDVGNTSLSLLIAAISVVALSAEHIGKAIGYLADPLKSSFTVTLTDVDTKQLSVFISNRGPGAAVFPGHALCSIWATDKAETLVVGEQGRSVASRYPRPEEVTGRYIYFFGAGNSTTVVEPGQRRLVTMPFRELKIPEGKDLPASRGEVKSYCFIDFSHENGEEDGLLRLVDSSRVSFFALDGPEVRAAVTAVQSKSP